MQRAKHRRRKACRIRYGAHAGHPVLAMNGCVREPRGGPQAGAQRERSSALQPEPWTDARTDLAGGHDTVGKPESSAESDAEQAKDVQHAAGHLTLQIELRLRSPSGTFRPVSRPAIGLGFRAAVRVVLGARLGPGIGPGVDAPCARLDRPRFRPR